MPNTLTLHSGVEDAEHLKDGTLILQAFRPFAFEIVRYYKERRNSSCVISIHRIGGGDFVTFFRKGAGESHTKSIKVNLLSYQNTNTALRASARAYRTFKRIL